MFGSTCGYAMKTPGVPHLLKVNDNAERPDTERTNFFHSVAAKPLYVTKQTKPFIELELAYFTLRVENSNVDDWKKMKRCITFIKKTKEDKRIIGCFNLKELFNWVDALSDVHPNI